MFDAHECRVCHTVKSGADELCDPEPKRNLCSPQTDGQANREAQCESIKAQTEHYCAGCGRPCTEPEALCIPQPY